MTKFENPESFSRRAMLKTGGALVVSIGMPISLDTVLRLAQDQNGQIQIARARLGAFPGPYESARGSAPQHTWRN